MSASPFFLFAAPPTHLSRGACDVLTLSHVRSSFLPKVWLSPLDSVCGGTLISQDDDDDDDGEDIKNTCKRPFSSLSWAEFTRTPSIPPSARSSPKKQVFDERKLHSSNLISCRISWGWPWGTTPSSPSPARPPPLRPCGRRPWPWWRSGTDLREGRRMKFPELEVRSYLLRCIIHISRNVLGGLREGRGKGAAGEAIVGPGEARRRPAYFFCLLFFSWRPPGLIREEKARVGALPIPPPLLLEAPTFFPCCLEFFLTFAAGVRIDRPAGCRSLWRSPNADTACWARRDSSSPSPPMWPWGADRPCCLQ